MGRRIQSIITALSASNIQRGEEGLLFKFASKLADKTFKFVLRILAMHAKMLIYLINKDIPWLLKVAYLITMPLSILGYNLLPPEIVVDSFVGILDDFVVAAAVTSRFNRLVEKRKYLPEPIEIEGLSSENSPNDKEVLNE